MSNAGSRAQALDHVVVVLFENRSLDNMLGHLYGPGDGKTFEGGIQAVDVQLMTALCHVIDHVTLSGHPNIVIVKIHARAANPLTSTSHLPSAPLPEQPFPAATTCTG